MKVYFSNGRVDGTEEVLAEIGKECESGREKGLSTGIKLLDMMIGGLRPGSVIAVGGRPVMGTTSLMLNMAGNAALKQGIGVIFFSLGMHGKMLLEKMAAMEAQVPYGDLLYGRADEMQKIKLRETVKLLKGSNLIIDDVTLPDMKQIIRRSRKYCRNQENRLIFIDHMDFIKYRFKDNYFRSEAVNIGRDLKSLAQETETTVIYSAYISKQADERKDHIPVAADLSCCAPFADLSDAMLLIYRDEYYNPKGRQEVMGVAVEHNMAGPRGLVELYFDKNSGIIRDLELDRFNP